MSLCRAVTVMGVVDSAFYPPWDGKMSPSQRAVMLCGWGVKGKGKGRVLISATYMVDQEQRALTISEVAVDWQEPMVLQRKCGHLLPTLTDIGPAVAASKHTTAPINHTRPSPCKYSPDVTTPSEMAGMVHTTCGSYHLWINVWVVGKTGKTV